MGGLKLGVAQSWLAHWKPRGTIQKAGAVGVGAQGLQTSWLQCQADPRTGLMPAWADKPGPPGVGLVRQEREGRTYEGHPLSLGDQGQDEDKCPLGLSASI